MGQPNKTLEDMARRAGGIIVLECRSCGRTAKMSVRDLSQWFRHLRFAQPWDTFTRRCVCDGCGARGPKATWEDWPARPVPRPPKPIPDASEVTLGVDPVEWAKARDESERKRLIRRARG